MALKILAQNALDAFSDPKTADEYVTLVERLRPDVAVFPEGYDVDRMQAVPAAMAALSCLGYEVLYGSYDETDGRKDRHGIVLVVRKELVATDRPGRLVSIGLRNVAEAWVIDATTHTLVHLLGMHLNDRSEAKRQAELDKLLGFITPNEPAIIFGDLNTAHKRDARGKRIWFAHLIAWLVRLRLWPETDPIRSLKPPKGLGRVGSVNRRLSEMASGKTAVRLQAAGFSDADPSHCPTFPATGPFVQLDHIMLSPGLLAQHFELLPRNSSDHLGIVATVAPK